MKITIDTQTKTVTIQNCAVTELDKVKLMLAAVGEDPNIYTIVSDYQIQYYQTPFFGQPYQTPFFGQPYQTPFFGQPYQTTYGTTEMVVTN